MHWLRDYGTLLAAAVAAVAAIWNAYRQHHRDRDQWLRDLRLPKYLALLKAADDYEASVSVYHALWDGRPELGPPPEASAMPPPRGPSGTPFPRFLL
jgi:hypothetical protein